MTANEKDRDNTQPIISIDRIIHEPARLIILAYLFVVESADFLFLMRQTGLTRGGLTRGNLSSHMSKLEAAGYVEVKKEFVDKIPHTLLSLTPSGREAFREYKHNLKQVLNDLPD
jgi:DNA-binding MarR family transcriptional regulator